MARNEVAYTADDCLLISKNGKPADDPSDEFLMHIQQSSKSIYCFSLSKRERSIESDPIVFFDYKEQKWLAGRYIGNVEYNDGKKHCSLNIKPRFGDSVLLEMFGEIFNLKLSIGKSNLQPKANAIYIKLLVSFIWSQKLAEANRHGLPRNRVTVDSRGYSVKGKLLIKPSFFSYGRNRTIISRSHEVTYDEKIIAIISAAHRVLKRDYAFERLDLSPNIKNMISDIEAANQDFKTARITEKDYRSVSYQPIYQSYKELVDFSWQILKSSTGMDSQNHGSKVSGYLIDMAEVWECYIRSLVQKRLKEYGWKLIDSTFLVYDKMFYHRKIIPDIVLEKDGSFCVFDAKYKRMEYRDGEYNDVDRADFFQIHTYISYLQHRGSVRFAGLLYPVSIPSPPSSTVTSLFRLNDSCKFIADGPYVGNGVVEKERFFDILKKSVT